jgi:hypothetical protein
MTVESAADRAAFLDTDDFGVTASLNGGADISGIFDIDYYEAIGESGGGVETQSPMFTARTSDLPGVAIDDTLTIDGTDWLVCSVRPDGTGMTVLRLEEDGS